ncbi:hypothetical protein IFR05_004587 [Cadophora sp. M221]|nr:hypothetical protein IFR05_004587 [Cadophora sp. M221]
MAIFDPAELSEEKRGFIEQKQFSVPASDDHRKFIKWQEECELIFNTFYEFGQRCKACEGFEMRNHKNTIAIPDTKITKFDFSCLVNWTTASEELTTDRQNVVNEYIEMIVEHVNKERSKAEEKEMSIQAAEEAKAGIQSEKKSTIIAVQPSCKMIPVERFAKIRGLNELRGFDDSLVSGLGGELTSMLEEINCTPTNFSTLDYLFIPIQDRSSHMGLARKQKFAFVVDSSMGEAFRDPGETPVVDGVGPISSATDPDRSWYIYGQYVLRSKKTDKSPNAVHQRDNYSCGAYVMTNAFCLAFGYNLEWYTEDKLDKWKKARISFELMQQCFHGEYECNMLKLSEEELKPVDEEKEEDITATDSDTDLEMQHGFEDSPRESVSGDSGYETNSNEGSHREVAKKVGSKRGRTFYTAAQALKYKRPRVKPLPDSKPWPSQFSKKKLQRAAFLYPAPLVNFQPELKCSKRELKRACRNFPLAGWKPWSKQSQPVFLEWMLNEMAATLSILHGDRVPLADGLVGGFCVKDDTEATETTESAGKRKRSDHEEDSEKEQGSTKRKTHPKPRS